jgi:ABC-type transport system involved in multi-copper enzyme maturation permease subunit
VRQVVLVAKNAFRAVMSQRALYMWAFAVIIMFLRSGPALFAQNRTPEMMAFLRANAVSGSLDLWSYLCMGGAIYLGATSMSSELRSKTIITVLSHPVRRWQMVIGKWIGISAFCVVTLGIGAALGYALARYMGVNIEAGVLAIAATRTIAGIVLFSGIATAVSTMGSAPIAVAITMFFAIVPSLIGPMREADSRTYQRIGAALDVVWAPFPIPANYRGPRPAFAAQRPAVDYDEQQKRTAETVGYASVYFLIGCVMFTRRDLNFG